jgi:hypothetical protein
MKTPHTHAELIKAWADGAKIQCRNTCDPTWKDMGPQPCWFEHRQYRIKPEPKPKPDQIYYGVYNPEDARTKVMELEFCFTKHNDQGDHIKLTFDGETGKLKSAEVL